MGDLIPPPELIKEIYIKIFTKESPQDALLTPKHFLKQLKKSFWRQLFTKTMEPV